MGSSSASTSGANKYARWRDLYDYENCEHKKEQKEVKVIRWISVPMANSFIYIWITLTRISTIFNSPTEKIFKGKNLTHDCVEAFIKCKICGKTSYYTLEFSSAGRKMNGGRYQLYAKRDGVYEFLPENMNLQDLYDVFDRVWYNISGKDYNVVNRNCKDYARSICHYINKGFYEIDEKRNNGLSFHEKDNFTIYNLFINEIVRK